MIRRPVALPWILAAACATPAPPPAETESVAAHLVELALENGKAHELLHDLCATAPHRLSGSEGAERAVTWAAETMQRLGLQNVQRQAVRVPHWERGDVEEVVLLAPGPSRPLAALALGGSVGTPEEGIEAEVLMVRTPEELAAAGDAARGRIVLFNRPMPRALQNTFQAYGTAVPQRTHGAVLAARAGAVAALVRSMTTLVDDVPHTGQMSYEEGVARVPAVAISTRAADELAEHLRAGEKVRVRIRLACRELPDVLSANVLGEIPGSERPEEIVVIGGHLDAWDVGEGAHDDGAGIVHCLEAVRLLLASGLRPRRTIRVVCFMNEENGLHGGRAYARDFGHQHHVAAIESDRGGFEPKGFTTTLRGDAIAALRAAMAELQPFEMGVLIPGGGGADISPLTSQGVPSYGLLTAWQRYFDYHHSPRDRADAVNPRELALGAAAMAWLAWHLANAE